MIEYFDVDPEEMDFILGLVFDTFCSDGFDVFFPPKAWAFKDSGDRYSVYIICNNYSSINEFFSRVDYHGEKYACIEKQERCTNPIYHFEGYTQNDILDYCIDFDFKIIITDPKFYYKKYLQSKDWRDLRGGLLQKRGFNCEICTSKKNLQLHHLTYERIGFENENDLMILCEKCHFKAHNT